LSSGIIPPVRIWVSLFVAGLFIPQACAVPLLVRRPTCHRIHLRRLLVDRLA